MKKTILKNPLNLVVKLLIVSMASFTVYSCDTFDEDSITDATRIENRDHISILPNTSAIIDFTTLINVRSQVSTKITSEPMLGDLEKLGDNLFKYTPHINLDSGFETISYSVYDKSNNFVLSDTLGIIISNDLLDSCFSAVQDNFYIQSNATTNLHVLKNDFVCDSLSAEISILQFPTYGTVQVNENFISYTTSGYNGRDEFVYRLADKRDTTITSDALVILSISDSVCQLKVEDDHFYFNVDVPQQYFDVLFNDTICTDQIAISVVDTPNYGTANFDYNNLLQYIPNNTDSNYIDSLVYKVCDGANCQQARVVLDIFHGDCDFVDAVDDMINISDTTIVEHIFIDVIANDQYCTDTDLSILEAPSYGSAQVDSGGIYYSPDESMNKDDHLVYKLCAIGNSACDTATVSIIREN